MYVAIDKDGRCYFPSETFPPPHFADCEIDGEPHLSAVSALNLYTSLGTWIILVSNESAREARDDGKLHRDVTKKWYEAVQSQTSGQEV